MLRAAPSAPSRTEASADAARSRAASCRTDRARAGAPDDRASQSANANIPFRRSTHRARAPRRGATITSVSRAGRESVAPGLELGAQLAEVVDLAVEDELDRARSRSQIGWLPDSRSMIESRRNPSPTADAVAVLDDEESLVVGAAVAQSAASSAPARRDRPARRRPPRRSRTCGDGRYESGACSSKLRRSRTR